MKMADNLNGISHYEKASEKAQQIDRKSFHYKMTRKPNVWTYIVAKRP